MSVSVLPAFRRLTAASAVAAAVVGATALPAAAAGHHSGRAHGVVYISGVRYDSTGRGARSNAALNQQWVAVSNESRRAVDLNGWTLSDAAGRTFTFRHYSLGAHATVRVHTGVGRDTRTDLYQDRRSEVWRKADRAKLRDDRGRLVDEIAWGQRRVVTHPRQGGHHHR
ncbi:Lamin Tail Domain [Streptomyces misionensis]|uniref:Lamin Tail Domain n=1 Tax=Streptomyces misionensis TaxID=67331 RepID=A0A1H4NPB4_9ACTN|nr:lamin tail domain-containing protein [Streptomyces misionensis]SEB97081.1 Lamin Tail Domain [Streptomyces misionensis]